MTAQPDSQASPSPETVASDVGARQRRLAILVRTGRAELEAAWNGLADQPAYRRLKAPETGLAMIRARAGGVGQRFNFGEMTMTRCVVALDGTGAMGVGYVQGRDARKAELVALFDALSLDAARCAEIEHALIAPAEAAQVAARAARDAKVAATKVDFFTLVRGED
ncbi:phosphonate C-P lyase system protein PhnG [Ferrovibrio xuzhouensis]|uniref:Phosphonate C-P lyase system protein PhnG n=1 Tax=Ferrovibrio xuzhouensis TaxID=1576914 RepID=A0ABV7VGD1_9PROT